MTNKVWSYLSVVAFAFSGFSFAADTSLLNLSQGTSALPSQLNSVSQTPNQSLDMGTYNNNARNGMLLPGETNVKNLLPSSGEKLAPPYGANLFAGGYETERSDGLNENYLIAAGDKINIWLWGAVNYSSVVTVDNQGNIFIPEVGPIHVQDIPASQINNYVTQQIKKVYINNVNTYVNLLTATPVSVYISGPVIRPGQYAGMASDSILYFLKRAGGIDSERGSYREIQVLRDNKPIADIDLYEFVRSGLMPKVNFKDGDVILVTPQKAAVTVSGSVRNPFRFELKQEHTPGSKLTDYSRPLAKVSHVGVVGNRASGPISEYMDYQQFLHFELQDGDKVIFNDDQRAEVIDVQVAGSYQGPSYFAVKQSTKLYDLLNHIPVDLALADTSSIYILRQSVAERQKQMLNDSLDRLERSVFTAPASSTGEATIRAQEAEMVLKFTERARQIQPLGKVIVSDNGQIANIQLEEGDQVVIPYQSDLVQVGGEVLIPQAVVFNQNAKLDDYIAWAGGFTDRADDSHIAIVRANGLVEFGSKQKLQRGDQILVLPKVDGKTMQSIKDITQVLYQVAVAANVALKL